MSPKVGEFDGIKARIYFGDHGSPHLHAVYQGEEVKIYIETLDVETGGLPLKQMKKLKSWIAENEQELLEMWYDIVNSP